MLCYGLLFVMWCEASPPSAPLDTFCQIARPIRWSATDTRLTKEAADVHNRKYKRLCGASKT